MLNNPYKIPRSDVDVQGLTDKLFFYYTTTTADTDAINTDVAARDRAIAELADDPTKVYKPMLNPGAVVPFGQNPDATLARLDAEIAKVPKTIKDHVWRLQCVGTASLLFMEYKVHYPLLEHHDLYMKVLDGAGARAAAFFREYGVRMGFNTTPPTRSTPRRRRANPSNAGGSGSNPMTTPPSRNPALLGSRLSDREIEAYLDNPSKLFSMEFKYLDSEDSGLWELHSHLTTREGMEYLINMDGCDGTIPLDGGALQVLLKDSIVTRSA
ncbi:hypothetical protein BXZ70DRAFT_960063 [Cristinia sonorae]|uniref:Uncharacterized protein n=1 Tax=Cristinia sonorae TaxID=1940300 RepID=A0A8K0XKI0_9AGAR|nr:hypothetical protein BXZ70DRAFT_960063 [Cristinia sonorae]